MKNEIKKTGYVEVEDITVQEAIKKALKQLNATKEDILIKVLKEEQKGLFGMQGAEKAKIRATLKPQSKKQE